MTTQAQFWDRLARRYAERPISNMEAYEQSLARTRSYLGPEDRVLELGAGTASTAMLLAPQVAHITATDISAEMVEIGREKAWDQSIRNITIQQGQPGDGSLGDGPYDVILGFNLLHLLRDQKAALDEVCRLLKPGGLFISKTPCLHSKRFLIWPMIKVMQLIGKAPFVRFMSADGTDEAVRGAGFDIIETGNYPPKLPSRYVVARRKG